MPPLVMTAEFSLFPADTVLGPSFVLAGFAFSDLGASRSFVKESGIGKGLQFGGAGLRVQLPALTDAVRVRGAAFAGDCQVLAKDGAGNVLAAQRIPGDGASHTIDLAHPGVQFVELVPGGGEGSIEAISITVRNDGAQLLSRAPAETVIALVRGVSQVAIADLRPENGDELQVRTASPLLAAALFNAASSGDRVAATYVIQDGVRILTDLHLVGR